jgi:two-component system sensor histidine kinase ChvG
MLRSSSKLTGAAGKSGFTVLGHDLRLGQVVTNLIENARSFVPETGGRIVIHLVRRRGTVQVRVEDNGPGIRAEVIERVFERFYTDRPDGEDFGQNSGLGLSISRQIIEAHGGTLTAENIPGDEADSWQGARFIIELPAEPR